jgi:RNA polymerase sigma factor (sigma-70 family)
MEFEQIYTAYFQSVYLYALQISGNEQIAEEITSETFYKAIHSIDRFRGDCQLRVWLCQIAKNTYYSYLKKHKKELSVSEADLQKIADPDAVLDEQFNTHSLELWSAHLGADEGWIWVYYSSETVSRDGSTARGSWNIPSLWRVEKNESGDWVVVQIVEHA